MKHREMVVQIYHQTLSEDSGRDGTPVDFPLILTPQWAIEITFVTF